MYCTTSAPLILFFSIHNTVAFITTMNLHLFDGCCCRCCHTNPAPGNCNSMSSTPRNSCSHFTKSRPSGVKLQQLYKNHFCFLSTHRKKLRVVNITHFTHSMGHRSPVLGHPTPAFVALFWYTSAWLVQQLFSINCLKSVIDSGVH